MEDCASSPPPLISSTPPPNPTASDLSETDERAWNDDASKLPWHGRTDRMKHAGCMRVEGRRRGRWRRGWGGGGAAEVVAMGRWRHWRGGDDREVEALGVRRRQAVGVGAS